MIQRDNAHVEALANVGRGSLTDVWNVGKETANNIHEAASWLAE